MTDHGGAASPRTDRCEHRRVQRYTDGRRPTCRDCGRPWAETQQERVVRAEGLRARIEALPVTLGYVGADEYGDLIPLVSKDAVLDFLEAESAQEPPAPEGLAIAGKAVIEAWEARAIEVVALPGLDPMDNLRAAIEAEAAQEAPAPVLALVRAAQDMATVNAERTYFVVPESVPQRLRAALDALPADILAAARKP